MTLTTLTTIGLFAVSAGLGWVLGGTQGVGVIAGFLAGASIAGLSLALQRRVAQSKPQYLVHAVFGGFLFKAFALLGLTLVVRFVPAIAAVCDGLCFLLAFAATAIAILLPATIDTLKLLEPTRKPAATPTVLGESRAL